MKSGVHERTNKPALKRLLAGLTSLPSTDVLVGIPQEKGARQGEPISNALIGYLMETGMPASNVPARPFLYPGVDAARSPVTKYLKQGAAYALEGNAAGVDRAMNAAGSSAASSVQRKLTAGPFQPLAASTLAARRRRGRTGTRPLIDTGQLRRAITYVVRKK